jgi:hypothetical protein
MRVSAKLGLTAVALMIGASPAHAQQSRLLEWGADAGLSFGLSTPKTTTLALPYDARLGFYLQGDQLSIEPATSLQYQSTDGGHSTLWDMNVGLVYHTSTIRTQQQVFFRPFIGFRNASASFDQGNVTISTGGTQLSLGIGAGMKWPIITNRIATRGEIQLGHYFKTNDLPDQTNINLLFGLSFYTR